jgi:hypothetical protein
VRGFLLMLQGDEDAAIESLERSLELFELVDDDTGRA